MVSLLQRISIHTPSYMGAEWKVSWDMCLMAVSWYMADFP